MGFLMASQSAGKSSKFSSISRDENPTKLWIKSEIWEAGTFTPEVANPN